MLDVHAPHIKLHGFGEFLTHLLTITVGLLIATQIESCVEWRHHVHLAQEARASLRLEIEHNLSDLKEARTGLKLWRKQVRADLLAMQRIQDHPDDPEAQHTSLQVNASGISLRDTAWRTAQSTGALAYMPYEEAESYSGIYQAQSALLDSEDKPTEDVAAILGLINKYHWGKDSKITREQAGAIAEKLGQMEFHLSRGDAVLQWAIEQNSAFLENRKPATSFTAEITTQ